LNAIESVGGVAAAVSLRAPSSIPPLRGLLLNYGVFARDSSLEAIARFGGPGNMLTADEMEGFRQPMDPGLCFL